MERVRTARVIFTFNTTTQAMKMERAAEAAGAPGRLIPVPREISAGCGMAWSAPAGERERLLEAAEAAAVEISGIYEMML